MKRPSSKRSGIAGWFAVILVALISGCASLPSKTELAEHKQRSLVLTQRGALNEKQATALLQSAAGISGAERTEFNALADAVRKVTDSAFIAGNKVTPLVDGPDTFRQLRRCIEEARSSVHVETYIFTDDALGTEFANLLISKAQQGVEVRVIVDALGSLATTSTLFNTMREGGVQLLEFRPLLSIRTLPWSYHNRDHRKLLIVDGKIAFTGGLNISGTYSSSSKLRPGPERGVTEAWRDTHARLEGPVVQQFQSIFFETWVRLGGQVDADNGKYFPGLQQAGNDVVAAVTSIGARQKDESIYSTYMAAIENATQRIWITQAYFLPPPELKRALMAAVHRGVEVRVLVPGFTDSGPVFYASRAGYAALLKAGVRLLEMDEALLHAKTAVIDGTLSIIGSANIDYRSFLHNNEVTAVIVSESLGREMESIFNKDVADAKEITLQEWQRRPADQRLKESLSRLFNYWL